MLERLAAILLVLLSTFAPLRMAAVEGCLSGCRTTPEVPCCVDEQACPCCIESAPESHPELPRTPVSWDGTAKLVMIVPATETVVALPRVRPMAVPVVRGALRYFVGTSVQAALCVWRT